MGNHWGTNGTKGHDTACCVTYFKPLKAKSKTIGALRMHTWDIGILSVINTSYMCCVVDLWTMLVQVWLKQEAAFLEYRYFLYFPKIFFTAEAIFVNLHFLLKTILCLLMICLWPHLITIPHPRMHQWALKVNVPDASVTKTLTVSGESTVSEVTLKLVELLGNFFTFTFIMNMV